MKKTIFSILALVMLGVSAHAEVSLLETTADQNAAKAIVMNALVNSDLHCLGKDRSQETFQTVSKEEVSEYTLRVLNNTVDGFSKQSLYGDRQMSSGPLLTVQISEDQSAGFRIILNAITSADHKRLSSLEIFTQTRRKDKKSGTAVEVYSTVDTAICKFQ